MKAIVTIIDDDGVVLRKDLVIYPVEERIGREPLLKRARFHFEITRALYRTVCDLGGTEREVEDADSD